MAYHRHYGEYFQYSTVISNTCGYEYCSLKIINEDGTYTKKSRRFHKVMAETFLENPDNLPVVRHRNNIKTDNRIENLYWTTYQENTQKAVDDGLLVNDKGYEDSQSHPVIMFDTYTNQEIGRWGSCCEAAKANPNISLSSIMRQCKYKRPVRKEFYFRFQDDKDVLPPTIVIQYDYFTDEELGRYWNTQEAARKTGISPKVVAQQCKNGWKPKTTTKSKTYFLYKEQFI